MKANGIRLERNTRRIRVDWAMVTPIVYHSETKQPSAHPAFGPFSIDRLGAVVEDTNGYPCRVPCGFRSRRQGDWALMRASSRCRNSVSSRPVPAQKTGLDKFRVRSR